MKLMLQPFWATLQAVSSQLPESDHVPWAFKQLPLLLLPLSLPELQPAPTQSQPATKSNPVIRIMSASFFGRPWQLECQRRAPAISGKRALRTLR